MKHNKKASKTGRGPYPIIIVKGKGRLPGHVKKKKKKKKKKGKDLDSYLEIKDEEVIDFFEVDGVVIDERDRSTRNKRNRRIRREEKHAKHKKSDAKREVNRRRKVKSKRDFDVDRTHYEASFIGLERKMRVKAEQEKRKIARLERRKRALEKKKSKKKEMKKKAEPKVKAKKVYALTKAEHNAKRRDFLARKAAKKKKKKAAKKMKIKTQSGEDKTILDIYSDLAPIRHVLVLVYQLYRSRSVVDYLAALHAYSGTLNIDVDSPSMTGVTSSFYGFVETNMDSLTEFTYDEPEEEKYEEEGICTQSGDASVINMVLEKVRSFLNGDLATGLRNMLLSLAAVKYFGKDARTNIYKVFGQIPTMSLFEFIEHFLDALKKLARFGYSIISGKTLTEAMMSSDPLQTAMSRLENTLHYSDHITTGLPVPGYMDYYEYTSTLVENVSVLEDYLPTLNPFSPNMARVKELLSETQREIASKQVLSHGETRVPPFGLIVYGTSGIGKSALVHYFCKLWNEVAGRKWNPGQIFPPNANSKYWEGYNPLSHPIIHFSEVGKYSGSFTAAHGDEQLAQITSLMDSLAFRPDMAFGDKGKVEARPELVICDTNNATLNADKMYAEPAAYLRRFVFIEPVVRPEYQKVGSTALDPKKSREATVNRGVHMLDKYYFKVYVHHPGRPKPTVLMDGVGLSDVTDYMRGLFRTHRLSGGETKDLVDNCPVMSPDVDEKALEEVLLTDIEHVPYLDRFDTPYEEDDEDGWGIERFYRDDASDSYRKTTVWRSTSPNDTDEKGETSDSDSDDETDHSSFEGWMFKQQVSTQSGIFNIVDVNAMAVPRFIGGLVRDVALGVVSTYVNNILDEDVRFNFSRALTMYLCFYYGWLIFFTGAFLLVTIPSLMRNLKDMAKANITSFLGSHTRNAVRRLKFLAIDRPYNIYVRPNTRLIKYVTALSACVAVFSVYWRLKRKYNKNKTQSMETLDLGRDVRKVPNKQLPGSWNVMRTVSTVKPVCTSPPSALQGLAGRATLKCFMEFDDGTPRQNFYALGLKNDFVIFPKHSMCGKEKAILRYESGGSTLYANTHSLAIDTTSVVEFGPDMLAVRVPYKNFKDITSHFLDDFPKVGDGMVAGKSTTITFHAEPLRADNAYVDKVEIPIHGSYIIDHFSGLCGSPVIMAGGKGSFILGIHFAGAEEGPGFCNVIKKEYMINLESLIKVDEFVVTSQSGETKVGVASIPMFEDPSPKSAVHYEVLPGISYFGRTGAPILAKGKSRLRPTRVVEEIHEFFGERDVYDLCDKPLMQSRVFYGEYQNPYNITLRKMGGKTKVTLKKHLLRKVVRILTERFIRSLTDEGIKRLSPLTLEQAINGVDDNAFIRPIDPTTSAGFGFKGKKIDYLEVVSSSPRILKPGPKLLACINKHIEQYADGRCCHPVYSGKLKDEPRPLSKVMKGKTRVFYMQPVDNLIVSRMFLSPFYTLMVEFNEIFCTAVGIDMHVGSHKLYKQLSDFSHHIVEGDYSGYDCQMPIEIGMAANAVVCNVLRHFGYTEDEMRIVNGILTDNIYPYVEILTDIFQAPGLQPSGKYATAEDNSLRGIILLLYAWLDMRMVGDFFDNVLVYTYGDDLVAAVKNVNFNNISYGNFVKDNYQMLFTAANKGEIEQEFLTPETMSFLKRHFKYDESFGCYVGYLPASTFVKTLTWYLPSDYQNESEQMLSCCMSMCREYAFYDSSTHYLFREFLINILDREYSLGREYVSERLVTLRDLVFDIKEKMSLGFEVVSPSPEATGSLAISTQSAAIRRYSSPRLSDDDSLITRPANYDEKEIYEEDELYDPVVARAEIRRHPWFDHVFNAPGPLRKVLRDPEYAVPRDYSRKVQRYFDWLTTNKSKPRDRFERGEVKTQSGDFESGSVPDDVKEKNENLMDMFGETVDSVDSGVSLFPEIGQTQMLDLDDFFERPVKIADFDIGMDAHVLHRYSVWDLFTLDPTVRSKLRNYAYFSCTLHARVTISATNFHYGRVLLSYQPYPNNNRALVELNGSLLSAIQLRPLLVNYLSQAPGSAVIDVKSNQPAEIEIPFISTKPMFRLMNTSSSVISDITSFEDMADAGDLFFMTINPVKSASQTPTNAKVKIFVWATDVKLGTSTGTNMQITTESGEDEREVGPVEKFSSTAYKVSVALSSVPVIAPLAKASSYVFQGVKSIASIFGWSKPTLIADPVYVKNEPYQNGAVTIGCDTNKRVVLDPKQELIVDPRVAGVDTDDLIISNIAGKLSYLTTFTWSPSDITMQPIWKCKAHPTLFTYASHLTDTFYQPAACAFAVMPFASANYRMVFRIEVVASSYHRGKLAIYFEPNIRQDGLITADIDLNKQYVSILDIQTTQTIEYVVDWAQPRYWTAVDSVFNESYGVDFTPTRSLYTNGYIFIVPFTGLQSPDDSDLEVNVYVSVEDLHVNQLIEKPSPGARAIRTQSGVATGEDIDQVFLNEGDGDMKHCSDYHFGEEPVSFRSLLKRYVETDSFTVSGSVTNYGRLRVTDRNLPINVLPYGALGALGTMNLFSYLYYAYLGCRGGMKKRIHCVGDLSFGEAGHVKITNGTASSNESTSATLTDGLWAQSHTNGTVTYIPNTNGGIEYEVPFYSNNLFMFSFADDMIGFSNGEEVVTFWNKRTQIDIDVNQGISGAAVIIESAAGEDFTFMRYQGAPYFTIAI